VIRDFLRYWLGIEDLEDSFQEREERLSSLEDNMASSSDLQDLRSRVRELEGVGGEFTNREWEVIQVLLDQEEFTSVKTVADKVETSKNNAGVLIYNVRDKIDLDVKSEGKKKLYRIPEDTRKEIFG
jgi:uncharacterized protein with von Willebrand factor type A (vWA) domain